MTVATLELTLLHVPPGVASDKLIEKVLQTELAPFIAAGCVFTFTVVVALLVKPFPSVIVTVYTIEPDIRFTFTVAPVVAESPVAGDQL